jgi:hypothetical protein
MFQLLPLLTILFALAAATSTCKNTTNSPNLTVTTRTGTFIGDLNDTYPNVRQFKYIPYAQVLPSSPPSTPLKVPSSNTFTATPRSSPLDVPPPPPYLKPNPRLHHLRPLLPPIRIPDPHRLGAEHNRKPNRKLRTIASRRRSSAKLSRRLSHTRNLDSRLRLPLIKAPRPPFPNRRRRRNRRYKHPNPITRSMGP